jgi:dipeptidyl aminopeptidase/acylaminoacyl peptidase
VLRVDDRGVGQSTGDRKPMTTLDEAADVRLEFDWLMRQAEIDPRKIALVGHSEGGLIAPIVASQDPRVAAIVTLAGPGFRGSDIYEYQTRIDVERNPLVPVWDRERRIRAALAEPLDTPRDKWFVASDPIPYARGVRVPALLIHGGNDLHVPPASAERLAEAMRSGGNRDTTVVIFPNMSHTLLPDADGTAAGWATLPEYRLPRSLLVTVQDWLIARLRT